MDTLSGPFFLWHIKLGMHSQAVIVKLIYRCWIFQLAKVGGVTVHNVIFCWNIFVFHMLCVPLTHVFHLALTRRLHDPRYHIHIWDRKQCQCRNLIPVLVKLYHRTRVNIYPFQLLKWMQKMQRVMGNGICEWKLSGKS